MRQIERKTIRIAEHTLGGCRVPQNYMIRVKSVCVCFSHQKPPGILNMKSGVQCSFHLDCRKFVYFLLRLVFLIFIGILQKNSLKFSGKKISFLRAIIRPEGIPVCHQFRLGLKTVSVSGELAGPASQGCLLGIYGKACAAAKVLNMVTLRKYAQLFGRTLPAARIKYRCRLSRNNHSSSTKGKNMVFTCSKN